MSSRTGRSVEHDRHGHNARKAGPAHQEIVPEAHPEHQDQDPISYHTKPGGLIYEPFAGSGTALIAAEELGRRCYAMELSPAFVDVTVERWQRFSGREAVRRG